MNELTWDDLDGQHASEIPGRDLLLSISLLGIPLLGLDGLTINVNTAGPNWLIGSLGKV